jgi:hypothetical protein
MSYQTQLPAELYRHIMQSSGLGIQDLCNMCLVGKAISSEAFRALYAEVDLSAGSTTQIELFIRTIDKSLELAHCIRSLNLKIVGPDVSVMLLYGWWKVHRKSLVAIINKMIHLKYLALDAFWDVDNICMPLERTTLTPWTTSLTLPQLTRLRTTSVLPRPLHRCFKQIPSPFPLFETPLSVASGAIGRVAAVRCRELFASKDIRLGVLKNLEILEHHYPYLSDIRWDCAPTLETLVAISGIVLYHGLDWDSTFSSLKSLKKVGPFRCSNFGYEQRSWPVPRNISHRTVLSHLRHLEGLEVTALILSDDEFHNFFYDHVMAMGLVLPCLRQVSLINYAREGSPQSTVILVKTWVRCDSVLELSETTNYPWTVSVVRRMGLATSEASKRTIRAVFEL